MFFFPNGLLTCVPWGFEGCTKTSSISCDFRTGVGGMEPIHDRYLGPRAGYVAIYRYLSSYIMYVLHVRTRYILYTVCVQLVQAGLDSLRFVFCCFFWGIWNMRSEHRTVMGTMPVQWRCHVLLPGTAIPFAPIVLIIMPLVIPITEYYAHYSYIIYTYMSACQNSLSQSLDNRVIFLFWLKIYILLMMRAPKLNEVKLQGSASSALAWR